MKTFTFRLKENDLIEKLQSEKSISDVIRSVLSMYYTSTKNCNTDCNTANLTCNTYPIVPIALAPVIMNKILATPIFKTAEEEYNDAVALFEDLSEKETLTGRWELIRKLDTYDKRQHWNYILIEEHKNGSVKLSSLDKEDKKNEILESHFKKLYRKTKT